MTWLQRAKAAELSVVGAAVTGRAALELYGLPGGLRARPEVVVGRPRNGRSGLATVHRTARDIRVRTIESIRVVEPAEVLLSVAGAHHGPRCDVEAALDAAVLAGLITESKLAAFLARLDGTRTNGAGHLRALLALRDGEAVPESVLETWLRRLLRADGVPPARFQVSFPWLDGGRSRVDSVIDQWRLIVEADGRAWHLRQSRFESDRRRDAAALAHGYRTLRLTWDLLRHDQAACLVQLLAIGAQRHVA